MITVRVRLRPCTADARLATVYYLLTAQRRVKWLSSGMRVPRTCWDAAESCLRMTDARYRQVWERVARDMEQLERVAREVRMVDVGTALDEVACHFRGTQGGSTLMECFAAEISRLLEEGRHGTARNYRKTRDSVRAFLAGVNLPLMRLSEQVVMSYDAYLQRRGVCRNTVSFYMRVLRALYNKYVPHASTSQDSPFARVYTGVDRTRKRAVSPDVIQHLCALDLTARPSLALCRDLFLFSFYARGMSFVDIVNMEKCDIRSDSFSYVRRKTGQSLTIRLEPELRDIMGRYARLDTPYVFPVMRDGNAATRYARYEVALNCYNRRLKQLSRLLGSGVYLTSYTARHTWATTARDCHIPISVISAGMGHTSQRTTEIYLSTVDASEVDDANRLLIRSLDKCTSLRKRPYRHATVWLRLRKSTIIYARTKVHFLGKTRKRLRIFVTSRQKFSLRRQKCPVDKVKKRRFGSFWFTKIHNI